MENLDPGDGAWWWSIGLQGVVGGVIGALLGGVIAGVATWVAVGRTLRHDREMTALSELRERVASLRAVVVKASLLHPAETNSPGWSQWWSDVFPELVLTDGPAERSAPKLADDLENFRDEIADLIERTDSGMSWNVPPEDATNLMTALSKKLRVWQSDPELYEVGAPVDWKAEVARIVKLGEDTVE